VIKIIENEILVKTSLDELNKWNNYKNISKIGTKLKATKEINEEKAKLIQEIEQKALNETMKTISEIEEKYLTKYKILKSIIFGAGVIILGLISFIIYLSQFF